MSKDLEANTTLSHYRIVSKIGAGGIGEVYRARDTRLSREVAIKLLPASVASDADRLRRFEQEARATSALNHPNILTIYDIGTHEETPFIVAELLEGEELRELLNDGPLPARKALDYGGVELPASVDARWKANHLSAGHWSKPVSDRQSACGRQRRRGSTFYERQCSVASVIVFGW